MSGQDDLGYSVSPAGAVATAPAPISAPISLSPPDLFACLTPTLYRSGTLTSSSHGFLATLSLRSILHVLPTAPRPPPPLLLPSLLPGVAGAQGPVEKEIAIIALPPLHPSPASWADVEQSARTTELLCRGLRILEAAEKPALVVDPAGLFLAAWRRVVGCWSYTSAVLEYRSFAGSKARYAHEEFLEGINVVEVRRALADWHDQTDDKREEALNNPMRTSIEWIRREKKSNGSDLLTTM